MTGNRKYKVLSSDWDHNGSFRVRVSAPFPRTAATDSGVRRAARSADPMGKVQWTRIDRWTYDPADGLVAHVTASRLDRSYR